MSNDSGLAQAMLAATRLVVPDELPRFVAHHATRFGAASAVVFLADLDQRMLVPLPTGGRSVAGFSIDSTLGGRSYRAIETVETTDAAGERSVWVPLVDGAQRLGVLQLVFPSEGTHDDNEVQAFAALVGGLIVSKAPYGDFFDMARRRQPCTVAAELLWKLLPPLTFASDDLVISAVFVPTADLGGDAFDYNVDARKADVALFDAMGHSLGAGLLATVAVAANRSSRRRGRDVAETAADVGQTVQREFGDGGFVTGVLASLDRSTGVFSWCVAGHPPPLLLRGGRVVKSLDPDVGMPLGVGPASPVFDEQLQPGDRVLLYTDGVTESRTGTGELFGVERLVDLVDRVGGGDPPPETMRRLMHAIEHHNEGEMRDDATVVMIEWRGRDGDGSDHRWRG